MLFLPINKTLLCTGLFLATIFLAVPRAKAQSSDYLNIQALLDDVQKKHQYVSLKFTDTHLPSGASNSNWIIKGE